MTHLLALLALALPHFDVHGDPLPPAAIARFGTIRFRVGSLEVRYSHALSPDGKYLAVEDRDGISLWDTVTGRVAQHLPWRAWQGSSVKFRLCFSPDGKRLARLAGRVIAVWDLTTGKELFDIDFKEESEFQAVAWVPDKDQLIVAGDQKPRAWTLDARTGKILRTTDFGGRHWALEPAGPFLLDMAGSYWTLSDPVTGKESARFPCSGSNRESFAISPDGKRAWIADIDGNLHQFDVATGKKVAVVGPPPGWRANTTPVTSAVSRDGTVVFMANRDHGVFRRDVAAGRWLAPVPDVPMGYLLPHADGKRLLVLGHDGVLHRYDLTTAKELPGPLGFERAVVARPSPDGRKVAFVAGDDVRRLHMFDAAGHHEWSAGPFEWGRAPFWGPAGDWVAVSEEKQIRLREPRSGRTLRTLGLPDGFTIFGTEAFATSDRGRLVVPLEAGDGVAVYAPKTGERLALWRPDERVATACSPDGRLLLYHDRHKGCRLFDLTTGRFMSDWSDPNDEDRHSPAGTRPGFTPDGSYLITWEAEPAREAWRPRDAVAILRDPRTTQRRKTIAVGTVDSFEWACSPDGLWLAIGDRYGRLHLFDIASGARLGWWQGHRDRITSVGFAGPGRIVTASADLTALLWDVRPRPRLKSRLWDTLSGSEGWPAWLAVWSLAADPKAPELLRSKITAEAAPPADRVKRLLADLGADRYAVREAATKELQALGRLVEPDLRLAREHAKTEEVRTRIDGLLAKLNPERTPQEEVQARAVAAMEAAGTPAARKLLAEWAAGAAGARLTIDAKAALGRLRTP